MKSLEARAQAWIYTLYEQHLIHNREDNLMNIYYFKLEGFADEPAVYLRKTDEGLKFGYDSIQWIGQIPNPCLIQKHSLTWESIESTSKQKLHLLIHELLMKTINSRKRTYRKCQFCENKVATEHRFDKNTCHSCASEHCDVVY